MDDENGPLLIQLEPRGGKFHISGGRTVLISALDGSVDGDGIQGLWVLETRLLSQYTWEVGLRKPTFSALSATEQRSSLGYYIFAPPECRKQKSPGCSPAQNSVEIKIDRTVGEGLLENVTLVNHTLLETSFVLSLKVGADFRGLSEANGQRKQRGRLTKHWRASDEGCTLSFDYKATHAYKHQGESGKASFHRGIQLLLKNDQQAPKYSGSRIRFRIRLKPRQKWHATLAWTAQVEGRNLALPDDPERKRKHDLFLADCARHEAPEARSLAPLVIRTVRQATADLAALRLYDLDSKDEMGERWVPAAGIPTYVGLFARDVLFCSRQAATVSTEMLRGTLAELARQVGTRTDDWRDEQPGRMIHEIHSGPTEQLNYTPHGRYFGGVTGELFYGAAVADLWHWTGNKGAVAPFVETAMRALEWADKHSRDKSGFYKYQTRSKQGEKNQAWKDSDDAIVYPDGSQVDDPLGTCEMQGCLYASKLGMANVLGSMGDRQTSQRLAQEARELKKHFNEFFWMPKEKFLAMGIDNKNRKIESIASNAGHCLQYGIVDDRYKKAVGRRLMADDLFSGWGIRTLSSEHPSFNPFSYHRGTVWPVENGEMVAALAKCGLVEEMQRLAKAFFEAAALFRYCRPPEVYSGHQRDEAHPFPALYPKTNSPQAWSASAAILVLQTMLGIQPYAPEELLLLDPHLPEWLPEITLHGLRVGDGRVSIRFRREGSGRTEFEVIESEGPLRVLRHDDPWSMVTGPAEKIQDEISALKWTA
jgi:glycogen debranching enzyme